MKYRTRTAQGSAAAAAIVALAVLVPVAAQQQDAQRDRPETLITVRVGTYEPHRAFDRYRGAADFIAFVQQLQMQAHAAQEAGDIERLMELQQELQQKQMQVIGRFEADVEKVIPAIARKAEVNLVVVEVVYSEPNIEPVDLTDEVVRRVNELEEERAGADDDVEDDSD
jgi:hypothetical protein